MTRKSKGQERRCRGRNPGTSQVLLANWKGFASDHLKFEEAPILQPILSTYRSCDERKGIWGERYDCGRSA